jgi:hypothetical protein
MNTGVNWAHNLPSDSNSRIVLSFPGYLVMEPRAGRDHLYVWASRAWVDVLHHTIYIPGPLACFLAGGRALVIAASYPALSRGRQKHGRPLLNAT